MRIDLLKNEINLIPESEVEEYYLEQFVESESELIEDSEIETIKPLHADDKESYIETRQLKLRIWH